MASEGGERSLTGYWEKAFALIAFGFGAFHFYTAATGTLHPITQRGILILVAAILGFMAYPALKRQPRTRPSWWEILVMMMALFCLVYFSVNAQRIIRYPCFPQGWDTWVSALVLIITLEATRRVMGPLIVGLAIVFLLYAYFGKYVPGAFYHGGMSWNSMVGVMFLTTEGVWGLVPRIVTTIVAIFILFGAMMMHCGVGTILINLVTFLGGRATGGAAKVAVLASALFGSISGSAVANIALTGSMTIPMMKRLGYKPEFAAATELSASTGGQFMPPIMGAGAFLIAEFAVIPYSRVIIIALFPALIYFFSVWMSIHFYSLKNGLTGLTKEEIPPARVALAPLALSRFVLPIGVLLFLLFAGFTVTMAGFWGTVFVVVPYLLTARSKKDLKSYVWNIILGVRDGGAGLVILGLMAGTAQVIITFITATPFAILFGGMIVDLSAGISLLALFLVMILSLIMGMGMPTTAAYVLAVTISLPVMHTLGFPLLSSHFFVFYFAVMSAITPPVAAGVFVAAPMAGAPWLKVARLGIILSLAGFLVPFVFMYSPGLLLQDSMMPIIHVILRTALAMLCFSATFIRYLRTDNRTYENLLLIGAGILFLLPWVASSLIALAPMGLAYGLQRFRTRSDTT
ncbi:TRAP transporter permease [Chloroflexota bacterium]